MLFLSKTTKFLHRITLIFVFIININAQSLNTELSNQYGKEFEDARFVFHRVYFEKASLLFENLIKKKQNHALTYAYAAMTDYMLFKDPTNNINKALSLSNKEDPNHLFTNALCSFAKDDFVNCELIIKEFLSINPNDRYALHVLGFTQNDLERPEDGLKTLSNLIKLHPDFFPAYNHIGYAHLKLNQNKDALNSFSQFLKNDRLNPSALDSYADGLTKIKDYDKAIAQLTKALLVQPNFAYGWKHMGDILEENGERELARYAYINAKKSAKYYGASFLKSLDKKINSINK